MDNMGNLNFQKIPTCFKLVAHVVRWSILQAFPLYYANQLSTLKCLVAVTLAYIDVRFLGSVFPQTLRCSTVIKRRIAITSHLIHHCPSVITTPQCPV